MNIDTQLKWQAFLDGELPPAKQAECSRILERDPDAQAIVAQLRHIRQALHENELHRPLPVTGDFYWSQIQDRLTAPHTPPRARIQWVRGLAWWRWFVPLGATAALALLLIYSLPNSAANGFVPEEIDTQLPDANFFTFRSLSDGISVVWVDTQAGYAILPYPDDGDYLMQ
jgi:anti-sigma factor RsiW